MLNGPDPGLNGDEGEADLDVEWARAVAPNATIDLVVSQGTATSLGFDLSALYIVENNLAPVMSESFGICEPFLGTAGNAFYNMLWEEAAAQGITVMVSAGDGGSDGCDDFTTATVATSGIAISGTASTPFNVAVGGTDFDDAGNQTPTFFKPSSGNDPLTLESALGYIPESTWNDSCAAVATAGSLTTCVNPTDKNSLNIVGGSGGPSNCVNSVVSGNTITCLNGYAKPAWQTGFGDNARDIPDVSLFASDGPKSGSFYMVCQADAIPAGSPVSCASPGSFSFLGVGGTSVSAPAFAGIMALINQKTGQRQGNANVVLYQLAKAENFASCNSSSHNPTTPPPLACVFNDITKGNDSVPCAGGSPNCSSSTANTNGVLVDSKKVPAFTTGTGYDLATGLGSVNVSNLVSAWASPTLIGTNTTLNGPSSSTLNATQTFSGTVAGKSGTSIPTGIVLLRDTSTGTVIDETSISSAGAYSISTALLPAASNPYNVVAHYGGDGTFAASDSAPISETVAKQNSEVVVGLETFTGTNGTIPVLSTAAQKAIYGSGYILRVDVTNGAAMPCENYKTGVVSLVCPTGTIQLFDNGSPLIDFPIGQFRFSTNAAKLNNLGFAEDQLSSLETGAHSITATYVADTNSSYNSSNTSNTLSVTITQAATTTTVVASPTTITSGGTVKLTATVSTQSIGRAPGGGISPVVQFFNGMTPVTGTVTFTARDGSVENFASVTWVLTTTLSALGIPDTATPRRPKLHPNLFWLLGYCAALYGLLLWKMHPTRRRGYAYPGLAVFALAVAGIAGCGGGGGSKSTPTPTPQSKTVTITAKFPGDSRYTASSGTTSVTIQ